MFERWSITAKHTASWDISSFRSDTVTYVRPPLVTRS